MPAIDSNRNRFIGASLGVARYWIKQNHANHDRMTGFRHGEGFAPIRPVA